MDVTATLLAQALFLYGSLLELGVYRTLRSRELAATVEVRLTDCTPAINARDFPHRFPDLARHAGRRFDSIPDNLPFALTEGSRETFSTSLAVSSTAVRICEDSGNSGGYSEPLYLFANASVTAQVVVTVSFYSGPDEDQPTVTAIQKNYGVELGGLFENGSIHVTTVSGNLNMDDLQTLLRMQERFAGLWHHATSRDGGVDCLTESNANRVFALAGQEPNFGSLWKPLRKSGTFVISDNADYIAICLLYVEGGERFVRRAHDKPSER